MLFIVTVSCFTSHRITDNLIMNDDYPNILDVFEYPSYTEVKLSICINIVYELVYQSAGPSGMNFRHSGAFKLMRFTTSLFYILHYITVFFSLI